MKTAAPVRLDARPRSGTDSRLAGGRVRAHRRTSRTRQHPGDGRHARERSQEGEAQARFANFGRAGAIAYASLNARFPSGNSTAQSASPAKVFRNRRPPAVDCPIEGRALIDRVLDVKARAPFDQRFHDLQVVGPNGLVERRRMGMEAVGVVPAWLLARIEEQSHDRGVTVLGGKRQGDMPALGIRDRQQASGILMPAQPSGRGQVVHRRAAPGEGFGGAQVPERQCGGEGRAPARAGPLEGSAVVEQRFHERALQAGLGRMTARYQHAHGGALGAVHVTKRIDLGAGVQKDLRNFDRVRRRLLPPVLDAVGGDIVQQRGLVPARRDRADQLRILAQHRAQRRHVTRDDCLHRGFESRDRTVEPGNFGECREIRPALETIFVRYDRLRVGKIERCGSHVGHGLVVEEWMHPLEAPIHGFVAGFQGAEEGFRL